MARRTGLAVQVVRAAIVAMAFLLWPVSGAQSAPRLLPIGSGQVRALIIGGNEYDELPSLKGALADALDFKATLQKLGVSDLSVFIEQGATRVAIVDAMNRLIARTQAGDLVIITFAGHGVQEKERFKGSEPDGLDEVFVLPGFRRTGKKTAERILDKEINKWLKQLENKNADVLLVADACFGGGLVRSIDQRADKFTYRTAGRVQLSEEDDELKPIVTKSDSTIKETEFKRVTFLGAANEATKVPELRIPGIEDVRGGLSYAIARAIEGAAARDQGGQVSRGELFGYGRQVVYQHSQSRQTIYTEPSENAAQLQRPVFRVQGRESPPKPTHAGIRIRVVHASDNPFAGVLRLQVPFRTVGEYESADLVWDISRHEIVGAAGDIIARNVEKKDVPAIVDRTAAIQVIAQLAQSSTQSIMVMPDDRHHRAGEHVTFRADDVENKYLILFNIAYDGTIQFLFPRPNEIGPLKRSTFTLPLRVQEPFGADHAVAIVSDKELADVLAAIRSLDGRRAAGNLIAILQSLRQREPSVRIGTAGLFTVP